MEKRWAINFALIFFCLMLLAFTLSLIYTVFKVVELRNKKEYESSSTFIKYEAITKSNIIYEVYKLIQSKKPLLLEIDYPFKWSGTVPPRISSNLQKVKDVIHQSDTGIYDTVILNLVPPLFYNQSQVLHLIAELDDTDLRSNTWVSNRIIYSVEIIHYRIVLKYKQSNYNRNAILEKIKTDSISKVFEKIQEIPFDNLTKSYEYHLLNPIIGYTYRIRWQR